MEELAKTIIDSISRVWPNLDFEGFDEDVATLIVKEHLEDFLEDNPNFELKGKL